MQNYRYQIFIGFTILFIAAISFAIYSFNKKTSLTNLQKTLNQSLENETTGLVEKVSKIIRLPVNETPIIDTVNDIDKYRDQVFFRNAQNKDVVLVYKNAKRAFLYRPSENKIIEVGWVKSDTTPSPSSLLPTQTTPSASPSGRVIYRPITIPPTSL